MGVRFSVSPHSCWKDKSDIPAGADAFARARTRRSKLVMEECTRREQVRRKRVPMRWCRSQKPAKSTASIFSIVTGCHPAVLWITAQTVIGSPAVFCGGPPIDVREQKSPDRSRGFLKDLAVFFCCYCDTCPAVSGTQVVWSLSYLNPGADFSASLVVLIVR